MACRVPIQYGLQSARTASRMVGSLLNASSMTSRNNSDEAVGCPTGWRGGSSGHPRVGRG